MATVKLNLGGVIIEKELEELSQASESETVIELSSDELVVHKKDEFETLKTNLGNQEYKNGKTAGEEMAFKAVKNASGYDIEGYKDADTLFNTIKTKVIEEANIKPTEQIKQKDADILDLQGKYKTIESEFTAFKTNINEQQTRSKKDNILSSFIPTEGLKVDSEITLMALKSKAGIDVSFDEEGKSFVTRNGEMVKDNLLQPIEPKTFIETTLKSLDLIDKPKGGGGGKDETGDAKAGSYDALVIEMKNKDIEEGTQAFAQELNKRIKDKTVVM